MVSERVPWFHAAQQAATANLQRGAEYYEQLLARRDKQDRAGRSGSGVGEGSRREPEKNCNRN